ncbi:poly-beta-1,6-N-acetyl-D-glucosamine N-deacetylase PgaB [Sesbania bispinosa]|nr:poly-beta-1,6-N-acetyl-D-glucosamine N-deacetylase PgaB [Sesbania bispinosa]
MAKGNAAEAASGSVRAAEERRWRDGGCTAGVAEETASRGGGMRKEAPWYTALLDDGGRGLWQSKPLCRRHRATAAQSGGEEPRP